MEKLLTRTQIPWSRRMSYLMEGESPRRWRGQETERKGVRADSSSFESASLWPN